MANLEWVQDPMQDGHYGGPSLATKHSKSLVVNHHVTERDPRDVSINYKSRPYSTDTLMPELASDVTVSHKPLSKHARRKMVRYGKVPARFR
jgi:hypothetical protein